jgi:hypothetical protein
VTPVIGDMVRYHHFDGVVLPALVTRVHSEVTVTLVVFGLEVQPACLVDGVTYSEAKNPGSWCWGTR